MKIKLEDIQQWNRWFAWYPVVVGGVLVWLEQVERRWDAEAGCAGDFSGYSFPTGDWEYRLPEVEK